MSSLQKPAASASQLELFDEFHLTPTHLSRLLPNWDLLFPFYFSKCKELPPDTKIGDIPLLRYEFATETGRICITVKPAIIGEGGKEPTRVIHAGEREQNVAEALRALLTRKEITIEVDEYRNREKDVFPVIRLGFYVKQIADELKRTKHTLSHAEIDEALEVLANTRFALESVVEGREPEKAPSLPYYRNYLTKGDKRIVVLNEIESAQILGGKYRAINNELAMSFSGIAKWIYRYIHSEHLNAEKVSKAEELPRPCSIAYSTLIERGVVPKRLRMKDGCKRVRAAMDELSAAGVFHRTAPRVPKGFEEQLITQRTKGRPKTEDVVWRLYVSEQEVEQIILENMEAQWRNPIYSHLSGKERMEKSADARKQLSRPKLLPPNNAKPSAVDLILEQGKLFAKTTTTPAA